MGRIPSSLFRDRKTDFDLCQLHVAGPQHAGIFGRKIGAQQVVPVALFRLLELCLIHMKLESLPRDLLAFLWYLNLHEPEGAARLAFAAPMRISSWTARAGCAA